MKSSIGLIVGAGLLATLNAWAQAPAAGTEAPGTPPAHQVRKPGFGPAGTAVRRPMMGDALGLFHQLDLSAEQKEKIKQIMEQKREQNKAAQESLLTLRQQLMQQVGSDNPDPDKIRALHRQIGEAEGTLAVSRAESLKEIKALLTPEQLAQWTKKTAEMRERMEQFRKQARGRRPAAMPPETKTPPAAPTQK